MLAAANYSAVKSPPYKLHFRVKTVDQSKIINTFLYKKAKRHRLRRKKGSLFTQKRKRTIIAKKKNTWSFISKISYCSRAENKPEIAGDINLNRLKAFFSAQKNCTKPRRGRIHISLSFQR